MGGFHRQTENRDVVEVVANLTYHLADPGIPVVAIAVQQFQEIVHRQKPTLLSLPHASLANEGRRRPARFTSSIHLGW
jgi:hypothetical protein